MSDNAETREAMNRLRLLDALDDAWTACPHAVGFCRHCTHAVLTALPPVAGPEVRPDETLRRIVAVATLMAARDAAREGWRTVVNEGRGDDVCRHWSAMAGWLKHRADQIAASEEPDWPDAMATTPAPAPGDEGLRARIEALAAWWERTSAAVYGAYELASRDHARQLRDALASPAPGDEGLRARVDAACDEMARWGDAGLYAARYVRAALASPAPTPGDEGCPRCYDAPEGQEHADWCPLWLDQRREVSRQQLALYDEHDGDYDAIITALLHERLASPAPAATEVGEGER